MAKENLNDCLGGHHYLDIDPQGRLQIVEIINGKVEVHYQSSDSKFNIACIFGDFINKLILLGCPCSESTTKTKVTGISERVMSSTNLCSSLYILTEIPEKEWEKFFVTAALRKKPVHSVFFDSMALGVRVFYKDDTWRYNMKKYKKNKTLSNSL